MTGPVFDPLDHLVYGTPDLHATMADLEGRLGVPIPMGERHPGWGTRNAILSLGGNSYLEIVGVDEEQPEAQGRRVFGVDQIGRPRLLTWAVNASDLHLRRAALLDEGFDLGAVLPGERLRPDGSRLAWTLTDPYADRLGGMVPFLISWEGSSHPGAQSSGCSLVRFRLHHALGVGLEAALGRAGIHAQVEAPRVGAPGMEADGAGGRPGLSAIIRGPAGEVELS